jgi:hypothetical protein
MLFLKLKTQLGLEQLFIKKINYTRKELEFKKKMKILEARLQAVQAAKHRVLQAAQQQKI